MTTKTETPFLARQTCRGHLERGLEALTVGRMPNGELRPYSTELVEHVGGATGRFHYCAECSKLPEFAARIARRPFDDRLVDAHLCPYCLLEIEAHYEPETGTGEFYSAHLACRTSSPTGRFAVLSTTHHDRHPFGAIAGYRFELARAAIEKAVELERVNTPYNGTRFGVVDLETNAVLYASERAPLFVEVEQARRNLERLELEAIRKPVVR